MRKFKATKETPESNTVVKELNAAVFSSTFKDKSGIQLADLYTYEGTQCKNPDEIVAHNTCAPIMARYIETIQVEF